MKKYFIIILLVFLCNGLSAQKEASIWYFGDKAGLDFNTGNPVELTNSAMDQNFNLFTYSYPAVISDTKGKLLFYTNGNTVWNRFHSIMPNGTNLLGNSNNLSKSCIVIPVPGSIGLYYIISKTYRYGDVAYSIIDTKGLGNVLSKNVLVYKNPHFGNDSNFNWNVDAIKHSNGIDYWIAFPAHSSINCDTILVYYVSSSGIATTPVINKTGISNSTSFNVNQGNGLIKFSPKGNKVVVARQNQSMANPTKVKIFDFNDSSGIFYNGYDIHCVLFDEFYSDNCCFSPDGTKLYVYSEESYLIPSGHRINQFDLSNGSPILTFSQSVNELERISNMQMAYDGKIYIDFQLSPRLSVVTHPNKKGAICGYKRQPIVLTKQTRWYFPQFLENYLYRKDFDAINLCLNSDTKFYINDSNGVDSVFGNFGDTTSGLNNYSRLFKPVHRFSQAGKFVVTLVSYFGNQADTGRYDFDIEQSPMANFYVNDSTQCLNENYFVFNDSSVFSDSATTYKWYFGDSTFTFNRNPKHSYLKEGDYFVKLNVISDHGCLASKSKPVHVKPMPQVGLNSDSNIKCLSGNSFIFTPIKPRVANQSDLWLFGDGLNDTSHYTTHTYSFADTFKVKLLSTTTEGCSDSAFRDIIVKPSPTAHFTLNDSNQCFDGNKFVLTNTGSLNTSSGNWTWDFGDNSYDTVYSIIHSYTTADTFLIKLSAVNAAGCSDSFTKEVKVFPSPKADFIVTDTLQCLKNNLFSFTNNGNWQALSGSWLWDFGDGNFSTNKNPVYSYSDSGNYKVKLLVTNQYSCVDSIEKRLVVLPSPVATFTVNDTTQCFKNNHFIFTNSGKLNNSGTWQWNFGDGNTGSLKSENHDYSTTGVFTVNLLAVNQDGCRDSMKKNVSVFVSPTARFSVNDTVQCSKNNEFVFNNLSVNSSAYSWDFGDFSYELIKDPVHDYASPGFFTVKLIASNTNCSDTSLKKITVKASPETPVINTNSPVCQGQELQLMTAILGNTLYHWYSPNGFTSFNSNPVIPQADFSDSGFYYLKTTVWGCESDSTFTRVIIYPSPGVDLGLDTSICTGDQILLDPGQFDSYLWQDNSTGRTFHVSEPGIYKVRVFNSFNCPGSDSVFISLKCPTLIYIPSAFSPNGDGYNDSFAINTQNISEIEINIFDRWGERIYKSSGSASYWDGRFQGNDCPVGVYYYQVVARDEEGKTKYLSGTLTLLR